MSSVRSSISSRSSYDEDAANILQDLSLFTPSTGHLNHHQQRNNNHFNPSYLNKTLVNTSLHHTTVVSITFNKDFFSLFNSFLMTLVTFNSLINTFFNH